MRLTPNSKPFRLSLGDRGEIAACELLKKQGYTILEKNYKCPLGEIDVIAKRQERIAFLEIKTRTGTKYGEPQEAVDAKKQARLLRLAAWYLKEKKILDAPVSFDVVAVIWRGGDAPEIKIIRDAFGAKDDVC